MTDIIAKSGKVIVDGAESIKVIDTPDNSNYVIKNKREDYYGKNNFEFDINSGIDTIQGYNSDDKLTFYDATDLIYFKKPTGKDLIITKNDGDDKITLKNYFSPNTQSPSGFEIDKIYIEGSGKIIGTDYTDWITGSTKADKITIGSGDDFVYAAKGKDTITIDGDGKKELYFIDGDGNDTVVFDNENAKVTLNLMDRCGIDEFIKSGNDLIITTEYENDKGKDVYETLTLKNVFDSEKCDLNKVILDYYGENTKLDTMLANNYITVNGVKNVFEGTKYKDEITGTKKADTIITGAGNDEIWLNKGNDKITVNGAGEKNIYINNGTGADTIDFTSQDAVTVNLHMNNTDIFTFENVDDGVDIKRMYYLGNKLKTEKTHLTNLTDKTTVNVNGTLYSELPKYTQIYELNPKKPNDVTIKANQVVLGGSKADKITVGTDTSDVENSVIFSGNGNDEITINQGNSIISGGKGVDNINLNTEGEVVIDHTSGDGNDVISLFKTPASININSDFTLKGVTDQIYESIYMYYTYSGNLGLRKSGDDLIFSTPVGTKKSEIITIKDYFAADSKKPDDNNLKITQTIYFGAYSEGSTSTISELFNDWGIWADGVKDEETKITTYNAYGDYQNLYNYSGTGKTIFNGGKNEDIYLATLNKKSDLSINTGDANNTGVDSLLINANYKNVRAFFNVNANEGVNVTDDVNSDNFMIFNKGSLTAANVKKMFDKDDTTSTTGVISIDKFFDADGGYDTGYIEYVEVSNNILNNLYKYNSGGYKKIGDIDTDSWVSAVKEEVAQWLVDHDYASAFDVINNAHGLSDRDSLADINSMLRVYKNVGNEIVFEE